MSSPARQTVDRSNNAPGVEVMSQAEIAAYIALGWVRSGDLLWWPAHYKRGRLQPVRHPSSTSVSS